MFYDSLPEKGPCHFLGDPFQFQVPALRAGSFLDAQAIADVSLPLSMLVNNSKRDHMLFTVSSSVFNSHGVDGQTVLDLRNMSVDLYIYQYISSMTKEIFLLRLTSGMRSWTSVQVCDNLPQNHPVVDGLVDYFYHTFDFLLID